MWVKLKKGHPSLGYFVGDVFEASDEMVEKMQLNEDGYTIPATKAEVEAAKAALAAASPRTASLTLRDQLLAQEQQIESLKQEIISANVAKAAPPAPPAK